jgi:hypothetical protein
MTNILLTLSLDFAVGPANHSSYWLFLRIRHAAPLPGTLCDPCGCSQCQRFYLSFRRTLGLRCQCKD